MKLFVSSAAELQVVRQARRSQTGLKFTRAITLADAPGPNHPPYEPSITFRETRQPGLL